MSINRIPCNWRNCATCTHWQGRTSTDLLCHWVEYDTYEKAKCAGGGYNWCDMPGLGSCSQWCQRYGK